MPPDALKFFEEQGIAIVVLALAAWGLIKSWVHTDAEFQEMKRQRDEWKAKAEHAEALGQRSIEVTAGAVSLTQQQRAEARRHRAEDYGNERDFYRRD
jgi:hypothetical protein